MDDVQVDLWSRRSDDIVSAIFTTQWDGVNARLSVRAPEVNVSADTDGPDLFAALQDLRKTTLEPLGWIPLCNGARVDCYPSGMARDMGGGQVVYVLPARRWLRGKLSLVGTFDPSPKDLVGTVDDQDAYFERFVERRRQVR